MFEVLKHTPIGTEINFFTKRFNERFYRLAYSYALKNPHRIMVESNGPWHGIDVVVFIKHHDIDSQLAEQAGKGSSYRAISNNGNVVHGGSQTSQAEALASPAATIRKADRPPAGRP
jgi:hypothetical protein